MFLNNSSLPGLEQRPGALWKSGAIYTRTASSSENTEAKEAREERDLGYLNGTYFHKESYCFGLGHLSETRDSS